RAGGWGKQRTRERVLVARSGGRGKPLVPAKRIGEKPRLHPHASGGSIEIVGPERVGNQLLKALHLPRLAAQLIVEAQHLRDEPGTKLKSEARLPRRRCARGGPRPHRARARRRA